MQLFIQLTGLIQRRHPRITEFLSDLWWHEKTTLIILHPLKFNQFSKLSTDVISQIFSSNDKSIKVLAGNSKFNQFSILSTDVISQIFSLNDKSIKVLAGN